MLVILNIEREKMKIICMSGKTVIKKIFRLKKEIIKFRRKLTFHPRHQSSHMYNHHVAKIYIHINIYKT